MYFLFNNAPNVLYRGKICTTGRPIQHLDSSTTKPCCCNSCSMWFCIVLLKYTSSGGEHMLLLNRYLSFSIHSAFQNMQAAYTISSLARRTRCMWFPTRMSNLDSSDHRTLFHFEIVHFKWVLANRTWRRFWTMFTYGFLFGWWSFSCLVASADGTADCVYRQWFLEVFLSPFSNVNDRIMPMSDAVSSEGLKTTGIQQRS